MPQQCKRTLSSVFKPCENVVRCQLLMSVSLLTRTAIRPTRAQLKLQSKGFPLPFQAIAVRLHCFVSNLLPHLAKTFSSLIGTDRQPRFQPTPRWPKFRHLKIIDRQSTVNERLVTSATSFWKGTVMKNNPLIL